MTSEEKTVKRLDPKYVWKFFFIGMIYLGFLGAMCAAPFFIDHYHSDTNEIFFLIQVFGAIFFVLAILIFIIAKLSHHFYRYELRKEGFRKESGIIWKSYNTIPYTRIQNIDVYRGLLDRILGLSRVDIHTAGNNSPHFAEGRLPGISVETANQLQEELIKRVNDFKSSSLL